MSVCPDASGEDLAFKWWARKGPQLVLDRKIYGKAIEEIKDAQTKRDFDRRLTQLACESRLILNPKVKR
jgi:hypothetical protein